MKHNERIKIAKEICKGLIKRKVKAVGIIGSVALGTDRKYSDLEMIVISDKKMESQLLSRNGMPVSLEVHNINDFFKMARTMRWDWPIIAGIFDVLLLYDPLKIFEKGRRLRNTVTNSMLKKGTKNTLLVCLEHIGKIKNAYNLKSNHNLLSSARIFVGSIAYLLAFLNKTYFKSENTVFAQVLEMKKKPKDFKKLFLEAGGYSTINSDKIYKSSLKLWKSCIDIAEKEGIKL
jgi:predicted nucleotidyltransferase